ncbi:MAG: IclR family transcriptional regulator [Clostridia bacterium]|nr:IclR family transcriptional regulator [Clostridia bacterium]
MAQNKSRGSKNIQSIERAYRILECFINNEELGLTEISNMVGLHKSTTNGIVTTLKNLEILDQNVESGKLVLGRGLLKVSAHIKISLKDIYEPYMKKLAEITEETVTLHSWNGGETSTLIDIIESPRNLRYSLKVGTDFPCNTSAIGKSILAALPEKEKNDLLDRMQLSPVTIYTITNRNKLEADLIETRKNGYGISQKEANDEIIGLGIAVFDNKGKPIGGIGVGGPSTRMTDEVIDNLAEVLLQIKEQIKNEVHC